MKKFLFLILILNTLVVSFAQIKYEPKVMIAKLYVSSYQLYIISENQIRVKKYDVDDLLISIKDPDFISETYYCKKYPEKYFNYNIYFIYDMLITHSGPYIIGINDEYKIIKISGFNERFHNSNDDSKFVYYNDSLNVTKVNYDSLNDDNIKSFITTIVKFKTYSQSPYQVTVKNITFNKTKDKISAKCNTVEMISFMNQNEILNKTWKVIIPHNGIIKILLQ